MNPMTPPDLHPDADALNAFVERALPDAERARIVAHMADCGRCREIVYLARAAAEPEMAPMAAAVNPEPRQGRFSAAFAKWRVMLIPAAALAAVGAVVLWVQMRPAMRISERAKLAPQTVAPASQAAPASPGYSALSAKRASPSLAVTVAPPAMPDSALPSAHARHDIKTAATPTPGMVQMNELAAASQIAAPPEQRRATRPIHLDADSAAMARYAPPPEPISPPAVLTFTPPKAAQMEDTDRRAAAAKKQSSAETAPFAASAPVAAPTPPNMTALHGELAAPAAGGPAQVVVQSTPNPEPVNGFALMRLARKTKLPSGLDSVSSAALLNRLVALDSAGSVFLSQDGGQHWEAVKAQWNGKALAVQSPPQPMHPLLSVTGSRHPEPAGGRVEVPATSNPEEGANAAPLPPPPAAANSASADNIPRATSAATAADKITATARSKAPEMLFRLVTDRHEVWVSVDGKVWRAVIVPGS
jgi:hypothetical protein